MNEEFVEPNDTSPETLQDYLLWQLNLTPFSDLDRTIGEAFIDALDQDGFLTSSIDDILQTVADEVSDEDDTLDLDDCLAVLHRIQKFDPPGVAAIDLPNCLKIQLDLLPEDTEHLALAHLIVEEYLPLVTDGDLPVLVKRTRKSEKDVLGALALLRSLNPRPGSGYSADRTNYIVPDIVLTLSLIHI